MLKSLENELLSCFQENDWDKLFILIKKNNLYYTTKINSKNFLQLLVIYENNNLGIEQFKKHFTKKELTYMAEQIDNDGYSIYHSAAFNGENLDILYFLLSIKNFSNMKKDKMTTIKPTYFAKHYGYDDWINKFNLEVIN